jgi:hypothetical protein
MLSRLAAEAEPKANLFITALYQVSSGATNKNSNDYYLQSVVT